MAWFTYKGDGTEYLEGTPARDMEQEDWERLDLDQQTAVLESPLYDSSNYKRVLTRLANAQAKDETPAPTPPDKPEAPPAPPVEQPTGGTA